VITDLFDRYHEGIYRYLYYRTGNQAAAEDLTSEVFLRMIRALSNYQPQNTGHRAWLFQIARNLSIDYFRKHRVRQDVQLEERMQAVNEDPVETIETELTADKLRKALTQLPENQRDVIVMRFVSGMPVAEVAQALHKSEDSIKSLQRRALQALRDILAEWEVSYV
jgi:RNA polymerase sigma-70 factor (ECF subfamily)